MARASREVGPGLAPASAAEMLWDLEPGPADTCVGLSISGGTLRTVEALARARARGARTVAVTARPDGPLARAAEHVLRLPYEPISRATPHSLDHTMTLLALAALAGIDAATLDAAVARLAGLVSTFKARAEAVAAGLDARTGFVVLGSGSALGAAGYGAAKLHEAGGLAAIALEGENVAHGANYAMRPGDHAVLLADGGPGDARTLDLGPGLARLGLSVSEAGFGAGPLDAAFETALWAQCLCLAVARARGLDVTRPGGDGPAAAVQAEWFAWRSPDLAP